MKRLLICLICLCFPLLAIATSGETKEIPAFSHNTCQIRIYSNFSNLRDKQNQPVKYENDTVIDIEALFKNRGYHPVTGFPKDVLSFDIQSRFGEEHNEFGFMDLPPADYNCWYVTANITTQGDNAVYSEAYRACRNTMMYDVGAMRIKEGKDLSEKIFYGAAFDWSTHPDGKYKYNLFFSESIDAVLLGARADEIKKYEEIPTDIGILKDLPYCCTPQDKSNQCLKLGNIEKI